MTLNRIENEKKNMIDLFTGKSASPHAAGDGRAVGNFAAGFERLIQGNGVEQNGLVKGGHERIDRFFQKRVIEFVLSDALDFVGKVQVLLRIGHPGRHRKQRLVGPLRPSIVAVRVVRVVPRPQRGIVTATNHHQTSIIKSSIKSNLDLSRPQV